MRARCIVSAAGASSGGTCPPWNLERRYISAPGAKGGGDMVKINGVKVQTEGRKPWADAPSEPIPGQRRKRNGIYPGWDSPEKIQQCLHCTNPDCSGRCPSKPRKKVGRPRIPMPEDFPEKEKLLRYHELIDHYGVNTTVITRWKKELRGKGEK